MKKTLTAKLKSDAVKQEIDRNEDLIRSCLRAVVALSALEGAMDDAAFAGLIEKTIGGSDALTASFAAIKAETKAVEKGDV
jgi:cullin-associated NEDD8-dissociated protein 1